MQQSVLDWSQRGLFINIVSIASRKKKIHIPFYCILLSLIVRNTHCELILN
jgi:hypothetical protein